MIRNDSLGNRMKHNYENRAKTYLTRRQPVIIRLDGRAFHTFTKWFQRPYDEIFHNTMNQTAAALLREIQGCKIAYTQSDEITLLLTDYDTLSTDAWFDYNVQKMCSISAAAATMYFNKFLEANINNYKLLHFDNMEVFSKYRAALEFGSAMFDSRCFSIPKEEVCNCFVWRQQDATRNAIQMLGQCYFTHKELDHKDQNEIQDMLMLQHNVNFNDQRSAFKRGVCVYRTDDGIYIDENIPIFSADRDFIERFVYCEHESKVD